MIDPGPMTSPQRAQALADYAESDAFKAVEAQLAAFADAGFPRSPAGTVLANVLTTLEALHQVAPVTAAALNPPPADESTIIDKMVAKS